MDVARAEITGIDRVVRRLARLGDPSARNRAERAAGRAAMLPMLRDARAKTPTRTGLLRASLAITIRRQKRGETLSFLIAPRRSFAMKNEEIIAGGQRLAIGDSLKKRQKFTERGFRVVDSVPPSYYGVIQETGHRPAAEPGQRATRLGERLEKIKPQRFLAKAFAVNSTASQKNYGKELANQLARLTNKK